MMMENFIAYFTITTKPKVTIVDVSIFQSMVVTVVQYNQYYGHKIAIIDFISIQNYNNVVS